MKLRVFCSFPMSGRTDMEIINTAICMRDQFKELALSKGFTDDDKLVFVDNINANGPSVYDDVATLPVWYLHQALKKLATCDVALFHSDWKKARGCVIEHEVCKQYDIPIYYYSKEGDESTKSGRYPWGRGDSERYDIPTYKSGRDLCDKEDSDDESVGPVKKAIEDAYHHAEWFFAGITDELDGDDWQDCRDMIDAFINAAVLKMKMEEKDGEA